MKQEGICENLVKIMKYRYKEINKIKRYIHPPEDTDLCFKLSQLLQMVRCR